MNLKTVLMAVLVLVTLKSTLAGPTQATPKKADPTAVGVGLYARIDQITKDGFTSTQYRIGDLSLRTWRSGHVVIRGATVEKLVNGEYWHGRVAELGIEKDIGSGDQRRVYKVLLEFNHGGK